MREREREREREIEKEKEGERQIKKDGRKVCFHWHSIGTHMQCLTPSASQPRAASPRLAYLLANCFLNLIESVNYRQTAWLPYHYKIFSTLTHFSSGFQLYVFHFCCILRHRCNILFTKSTITGCNTCNRSILSLLFYIRNERVTKGAFFIGYYS